MLPSRSFPYFLQMSTQYPSYHTNKFTCTFILSKSVALFILCDLLIPPCRVKWKLSFIYWQLRKPRNAQLDWLVMSQTHWKNPSECMGKDDGSRDIQADWYPVSCVDTELGRSRESLSTHGTTAESKIRLPLLSSPVLPHDSIQFSCFLWLICCWPLSSPCPTLP